LTSKRSDLKLTAAEACVAKLGSWLGRQTKEMELKPLTTAMQAKAAMRGNRELRRPRAVGGDSIARRGKGTVQDIDNKNV
jgi:hypothetical protein